MPVIVNQKGRGGENVFGHQPGFSSTEPGTGASTGLRSSRQCIGLAPPRKWCYGA